MIKVDEVVLYELKVKRGKEGGRRVFMYAKATTEHESSPRYQWQKEMEKINALEKTET